MQFKVQTSKHIYDVYIEKQCLRNHLHMFHKQKQKVALITDDGIPIHYLNEVKESLSNVFIYTIKCGETQKSLIEYEKLCHFLLSNHFSREDLLISFGGGVVGDLSGFVAATYMRGIKWIQIPTTTLSQIDSSIGGKVAINFGNIKNILGAFYPPSYVFIDPNYLKTLSQRHYKNGLVEAIKVGLLKDEEIIRLLECNDWQQHIQDIIYRALQVKKYFVEHDEFDRNDRMYLNFGHTIGHAIESYYQFSNYLHGECVAIGMLVFIHNSSLQKRILNVFHHLQIQLPPLPPYDAFLHLIQSDKKQAQHLIQTIQLYDIGKVEVKPLSIDQIPNEMEEILL